MVSEKMAHSGEPYYKMLSLGLGGYIRVYDSSRANILKAAGLDKENIANTIIKAYE
jgi:hypothetical protein